MFSLILTLIAIALVAVLALVTIYYGGSAFKEFSPQAKAAQVVLEGQQISAAVSLFQTKNNVLPGSMSSLTADAEFLVSAPNDLWTFSTDYVIYPMTDVAACKKANLTLGFDLADIPLCSAVVGKTICCQTV